MMSWTIREDKKIDKDTYTTTGDGVARFEGNRDIIYKHFTIQVNGVGAVPTAWNVDVEGSIDGVNWGPMFSHATGDGSGKPFFSGAQIYPCVYYRTKCTLLTLGSATAIDVFILATP